MITLVRVEAGNSEKLMMIFLINHEGHYVEFLCE